MKTGELIRKLRLEKGLTQEQLGEMVGVQKSAVAKWENGKVENIKRTKLQELGKIFGVSPTIFLEVDKTPAFVYPDNIIPIPPMKRVPIIGEIACGEPIYRPGEYGELAEIPEGVDADFALRANGDSMTGARIYDGDLVFCRATDIVDNGRIAAVSIDDEATLKRFYLYEDKGLLILKPENPDYEDLIYTGDELNSVRVLGQAVAFQSLIK